MKKFLILAILFLIGGPLLAQQATVYTKIKLKDGAKLKVKVIENVPGDYLKFQVGETASSELNYDQIESLRSRYNRYQAKFELKRGVFFDASYAMLFGRSNNYSGGRFGMSLAASGNYRFNNYLSIGLGVEAIAMYVNSDFSFYPVFLKVSGDLKKTRISPVYNVGLGYSAARAMSGDENVTEIKGGIYGRLGIGVRFNKFILGLDYQTQKVDSVFEQFNWWGGQSFVEESRVMRNFRLSGTVIF